MNFKYLYHATSSTNVENILKEGLRPGCDGVVYMTSKPEEALRFKAFSFDEIITVLKVDVRTLEVFETFDHSEMFFKSKAYGVNTTIPATRIKVENDYRRTPHI